MSDWILVTALGAVAAVDSAAFFQGMINQPLVICTLVGAGLGLPFEGAYFGALLQMLWLNKLPVGTSTYPDSGPAAVGAAGGGLLAMQSGFMDMGLAGLAALLAAIPLAQIGGHLTILQREYQSNLLQRAETHIEEGRPGRIRYCLITGIAYSAIRGIVVAALTAGVTLLLLWAMSSIQLEGKISAYKLLAGVLGIGVGISLGFFSSREYYRWLAGGVVLGITLLVLF